MLIRTVATLGALLTGTAVVCPDPPPSQAFRTDGARSNRSSVTRRPDLAPAQVDAWVQNWRTRLGLTEWKIDTRIVRQAELPKGTIANVQWSLPQRSATIKVLHPADSTLPAAEILADTELSIVHELVHLSMAKLPLDGGDPELEEEAVHRLSKALVALDKRESGR